jgi:hypothetical protein
VALEALLTLSDKLNMVASGWHAVCQERVPFRPLNFPRFPLRDFKKLGPLLALLLG